MLQQSTLWRFMKRDASSMETGNGTNDDSPPPSTPKRARNTSTTSCVTPSASSISSSLAAVSLFSTPSSSNSRQNHRRNSINNNNNNNNHDDNNEGMLFLPIYPLNSMHTASRTLSSPGSLSTSTTSTIFSSKQSPTTTTSTTSTMKMDCDDAQMILDCGQKRFGPELCPQCGMFYSPINGQDVQLHERYHRESSAPPKFPHRRLVSNGTAAPFACVQEHEDGYVFKCRFDDEQIRTNKNGCRELIEEICAKMNDELGQTSPTSSSISSPIIDQISTTQQRTGIFSPLSMQRNSINSSPSSSSLSSSSSSSSSMGFEKPGRQLYVFVNRSPDCAVGGILIVDHIKFAYRYNSDGNLDDQPRDAGMGVNRIWTWQGARRRRIATRLLECARCNFYFGAPIKKNHVAFSDPTMSGLEFAKKFSGCESVLVYRFG